MDPFNFSKKFDKDKIANEVYIQIQTNMEGLNHSTRQRCFFMMWEYEKRVRLLKQKEEKPEENADPKKKLTDLKRAQKLLKQEIKSVEEQIRQSEIKASGQLDIEQAIEEEIQHVRNKNGYK